MASKHRSLRVVWPDSSSSITVDSQRSQLRINRAMLPKSHSHRMRCSIIPIHLQTKKIRAKIIKQIIKSCQQASLKIRTITIKSSPTIQRSMRIESHSSSILWVLQCHLRSAQAIRNRGVATVILTKLQGISLAGLTAMRSQVMPQKLGTLDLILTRTRRKDSTMRAESCLGKDATTITKTNNPLTTITSQAKTV